MRIHIAGVDLAFGKGRFAQHVQQKTLIRFEPGEVKFTECAAQLFDSQLEIRAAAMRDDFGKQ